MKIERKQTANNTSFCELHVFWMHPVMAVHYEHTVLQEEVSKTHDKHTRDPVVKEIFCLVFYKLLDLISYVAMRRQVQLSCIATYSMQAWPISWLQFLQSMSYNILNWRKAWAKTYFPQ